jgi:thiamine pyrophosphokinase
MKDNVFDAVVVAGGEYPTAAQPLAVLQNAPLVVCCDGAADRHIAIGRTPDAIVGDGD